MPETLPPCLPSASTSMPIQMNGTQSAIWMIPLQANSSVVFQVSCFPSRGLRNHYQPCLGSYYLVRHVSFFLAEDISGVLPENSSTFKNPRSRLLIRPSCNGSLYPISI